MIHHLCYLKSDKVSLKLKSDKFTSIGLFFRYGLFTHTHAFNKYECVRYFGRMVCILSVGDSDLRSWIFWMMVQYLSSYTRFSWQLWMCWTVGFTLSMLILLSPDIKEAHVRTSDNSSSDVRLTNTAVYGPQIENLSELRAPDAEAAGYMLDSALTKIHTLNG